MSMRPKESRERRKTEKQVVHEKWWSSLDPAVRDVLTWDDYPEQDLLTFRQPIESIVQEYLTKADFLALTRLTREVTITEVNGRLVISTGSRDGAAPPLPKRINEETVLDRFLKSKRAGHTHNGTNFPHRVSLEDYGWAVERIGDPQYLIDDTGIIVYTARSLTEEYIKNETNKLSWRQDFGQYPYDDRVRDFSIKHKLMLADVKWDDDTRIPLLLDWINMRKSWDEIKDNFTPPTK